MVGEEGLAVDLAPHDPGTVRDGRHRFLVVGSEATTVYAWQYLKLDERHADEEPREGEVDYSGEIPHITLHPGGEHYRALALDKDLAESVALFLHDRHFGHLPLRVGQGEVSHPSGIAGLIHAATKIEMPFAELYPARAAILERILSTK